MLPNPPAPPADGAPALGDNLTGQPTAAPTGAGQLAGVWMATTLLMMAAARQGNRADALPDSGAGQ